MKTDVKTLDAGKAGSIDLDEAVFGLAVRKDILHRVVHWQLAKRRATARAAQERGDVNRTGAKFGRQKGGGRARHGDRKANIFIGGGKAHGPKVRDFGYQLPKKVRSLGLKTALSAKQAAGQLIILDTVDLAEAKTKTLAAKLEKLGISSALVIDGETVNENFKRAASNLPLIDVLPVVGANVYDILRRDVLVLTKAAVEKLEARLK
ncbi:MAG: 50S ribosomal protein L4 [Pseudomonadota bacterium]|jgi:large subunit ribosomal protein L4